jgi:hypothetical protein
VPLTRLWLHSKQISAADALLIGQTLANHYRMHGHHLLAAVMPHGDYAEALQTQLGLIPQPGEQLAYKVL